MIFSCGRSEEVRDCLTSSVREAVIGNVKADVAYTEIPSHVGGSPKLAKLTDGAKVTGDTTVSDTAAQLDHDRGADRSRPRLGTYGRRPAPAGTEQKRGAPGLGTSLLGLAPMSDDGKTVRLRAGRFPRPRPTGPSPCGHAALPRH